MFTMQRIYSKSFPHSANRTLCWPWSAQQQQHIRHQAFDAGFDKDKLEEARKWHKSFRPENLPEGETSYSRSSGPGGQHVNKCVVPRSPSSDFQLTADIEEQKPRQPQFGPLTIFSQSSLHFSTRVSDPPNITLNGAIALAFRPKLSAVARPTRMKTTRNCLKKSKGCIEAPFLAK